MSKEWESFSEVGIDVPSTESAAMISSQVSTGKNKKMPTRKINWEVTNFYFSPLFNSL